jgi:hypothetical protein
MPAKTKKIIRIISLVLILTLILLISIAYIQYRDIKRAFVAKLSSEVTAFIGQDVAVGDISFSPSGEINLHTITVQNPEGFTAGKLLTIKKLSLKMRYKELLKKNLYFDRISIQKPELILSRDNEGRFNISDKLRDFFSRKPTLQYQIDEFIIESGIVNFNNDNRFRSDDVDLLIQNLSSEQDTKTTIRGHASYADSRIEINGWVYPKNEPKRLNISVSSQDVSLSALKDLLNKSGAEITKTKVTAYLNAEGDTAQGVNFSSEIRIRDAKFSFLKKDVKEIYLRIQAFLNIPDKTLVIENTFLNAGGVTAITVNGKLKEAKDDFLYAADLKIDKLDLSAMNFMKDVTMSGVINSEKLHVRGNVKKLFPELSGNIQLRDAQFQRRDVAVGRVNGDLKFLPGKRATLDLKVKDLKYGAYTIPWLQGRSEIEYRNNIINLKTTAVESQSFSASSNYAVIRLPQKNGEHGVWAEMRGLSASYPERKAGIRNVALSINVNKVSKVFTGTFDFAADEILFNDIRTGVVKGRGTFNEKKFSIDIAQADIAGGRIRLTAGGRTSGDMFPMTLASSANNIKLEYLMRDIAKISSISYPISGNITRAVFEGTINSVESVQGKASIQAEKISIALRDKQRTVIREGMVSGDIVFKGNDFDIRADAGAGKLSADIVGTVKSFGHKHRSGELKISTPEVKVADIRETFWDVFPDSMLYAGMEGFLASDLAIQYDDSSIGVKGTLMLNDIVLKGENGEYTVGPINGIIPVAYAKGNNLQTSSFLKEREGAFNGIHESFTLQSFERNTFRSLSTYYAKKTNDKSYSLITVGTVSYGFPLLDAINIWIRPEGKFLHVGHFSGNIFGGKLNGSAIIDLADAFQYKAGFHIEGLSLTELCDSIEPIRGYIMGKVDGIATAKGDGGGLSRLIGKADFWTYSTKKEKTKISKEFLHKIGGPSLQRYLGDRTFDKGTMSLYLQQGFVIFRELEISNRNFFGMKDLDIKVAPLSNRISLDHLMWSITEAAYRAQKKE